MFKRRKEMQSLINSSRKNLAKAEENAVNLTEDLRISRHNNIVLLERNRKVNSTIKNINELVTSNTYNNDKIILNKIKELIRPLNQN